MAKLRGNTLISLLIAILLAVSSWDTSVAVARNVEAGSENGARINTDINTDEKALGSQVDQYVKLYAAGDAHALANMWTSEGTYTDPDGHKLKGRAAIENYFASGFKEYGTFPLNVSIESIRFPASNIAIEEGSCRTLLSPASGSVTRYTAVHVKENGQWLMALVVETDGPQMSPNCLNDLSWLVGNWTAKGPKNTVHFKADWSGKHKFIHCTFFKDDFKDDKSDNSKLEQLQIIGWNPIGETITSWSFDSTGGYGYGKWLRDGDSWIESANGIEADGTINSGIHTIHKLNDNSFTWRSTGRSLGNRGLPDTQEITVTRDLPQSN